MTKKNVAEKKAVAEKVVNRCPAGVEFGDIDELHDCFGCGGYNDCAKEAEADAIRVKRLLDRLATECSGGESFVGPHFNNLIKGCDRCSIRDRMLCLRGAYYYGLGECDRCAVWKEFIKEADRVVHKCPAGFPVFGAHFYRSFHCRECTVKAACMEAADKLMIERCPHGHIFGVDIDDLKACDRCDVWRECAREADRLENARKAA
jgi:hypothetical protein